MRRILSLASLLSILSVGAALAQVRLPVSAEQPSPADDRMMGASSPVAGHVEVHEMRRDGDVMRMRALADGLPLPAGKPVALWPGGFHITLVGLNQPLGGRFAGNFTHDTAPDAIAAKLPASMG